jgi:hypothetical protein
MKNDMGAACSTNGGEEREMCTAFWWGNLRERGTYLEGLDERIILKWIFQKWGWRAWT